MGMGVEGLVGAVVAGAAGGGHGQLVLQVVKTGATALAGARDVAVRYPVAEANYHVKNVMRVVRISKRIHMPSTGLAGFRVERHGRAGGRAGGLVRPMPARPCGWRQLPIWLCR